MIKNMNQYLLKEHQNEVNFELKLILCASISLILLLLLNESRNLLNNVLRLRAIVMVKLIEKILSVGVVHKVYEYLENCIFIVYQALFKLKFGIYKLVYLISNIKKILKDVINTIRSLFIVLSIFGKFILKIFAYIHQFTKK